MNIEEFKQKYSGFKDSEKIEIICDCEKHEPKGEIITIGKQPAKRNILKNGGEKFICRKCCMKYDNPVNKKGPNRQTSELIIVICNHPEHEGNREREIKKSAYFGSMKEPYVQICKSCTNLGREISNKTKEKISKKLTGRKLSPEHKQKLLDFWENNPERKQQSIEILLEHRHKTTGMLGKKHTEETKAKMSEAHKGRAYSDEHKQNISKGRKKMLEETGGFTREHREKLSKATKLNYKKGFDSKKYHYSGWHNSSKAGQVYYRSGYEKKAFLILDKDKKVKTYQVETIKIPFFNPVKNINGIYIPDIEVEYVDGSKKIIEIKPEKWVESKTNVAKFEAATNYAKENNIYFEIWTEIRLFGPVYNEKLIKNFLESFESEERKETRKESNRKKAKKHYNEKIAKDKVNVYCEYCKKVHTPLRITYEKNIERNNGNYICGRHGGHIAGSKSKK